MIQSRSGRCWKIELAFLLAISEAIAFSGDCTLAQSKIISDDTLGSESSILTPNVIINGFPSDQISGGAKRGANLFHSFQELNVDQGQRVYFTNPTGVENILSRVTGGNSSNILGTLGVTGGNANLFLINPKGIIFGANASLDVGGSFVATTANAIQFGNQGFFNASAPNELETLTVNPSALLFNQIAAMSITSNSKAPAGQRLDPLAGLKSRDLFGLRVPDGRSLLLVGGNVSLDGGVPGGVGALGGGLNALGGRVELAAVAGEGTIGLDVSGNNLSLSFPKGIALADVSLINRATIDTSSEMGGGDIQVWGKQVMLTSNSRILSTALGAQPGGDLTVNASESIKLLQGSRLSTTTEGDGSAGDLTINTRQLIVQDGSQVLTSTSGKDSGGQLTVNALEFVKLSGSSRFGVPSGLLSSTAAEGDAGELTINTNKLIIQDGARVSTESATSFNPILGQTIPATGRGGDLTVNASESVELIHGLVLTNTSGSGRAGDLTINTGKLAVQNGSEVSVGTLASSTGQGGNLTINASESVEVIGTFTDKKGRIFPSSLFAASEGSGNSGSLNIKTNRLFVRDGATVTVSSLGTGIAGDIKVTADSIELDRGKLTATSESGEGGNIRLQDLNLLLLRDQSEISTNADSGSGNGGDINIDTDVLVGIENSDITATAVKGRGGNIQINTQEIFGIEPRSRRTSESDITASSDLGVDGVVEINRPEAEPSSGLVTLPAELVEVSGLIAQGCGAGSGNVARGASQFVATGRGGLPPTPIEALRSDAVLADLGTSVQSQNRASAASPIPTNSQPTPIVEAQGWMIGSKGEVMLTAQAPTVTRIPWLTPTSCNAS